MNQNGNSRFLFIIDLAGMYVSFFGWYIRLVGFEPISLSANLLMLFVAIAWFFISINTHVCRINRQTPIVTIFKNILVSYSVLSSIVIATVAIFDNFRPNDKLILYPLLFAVFFSSGIRIAYLIIARHFIYNGYTQKNVLVVGEGLLARKVVNIILQQPELGYRLYGIISDQRHHIFKPGFYIGDCHRLCELIQTKQVDEIIIALPLCEKDLVKDIMRKCEYEGVRFRILPDLFSLAGDRVIIESIGGLPLVSIRTEPLNILGNRIIKRVFDLLVSLIVLVCLSPIIAIIAFLVKVSSSGPVFFKQQRIGINNLEFYIYKFRTMVVQEAKASDTLWTQSDDDRVTALGKFLRNTNLDELPQFWNVLIGDMSIVGPRPERLHFVEQFKEQVSSYKVRHLVKSGITGWAQANGWRGDTSIEKRVEHDLYYIENWSFWLDLKIIWMTLFSRKAWQHAY